MLTEDPHMLEQIRFAQLLSRQDSPVLIMGESGTGKEHFAKILHGKRHAPTNQEAIRGPNFVPVNVATLQEDLFESLLYGHLQGAFTGATRETSGLVQLASSGTLFLDEIGELSLSVQPKLLRFIQHKTYRKVGASKLDTTNCRIVCSTNRDLRKMLKNEFRLDLYHRISTFIIKTTPLRERPNDLTLYIHKTHKFEMKKAKTLANKILKLTPLDGNYREVQSIMARYELLGEFIIY
jgi:transcriptional regulator with PAS, ATPase and Fis domain